MRVHVAGVSVLGPGLPGWDAAEAVLAGAAPWQPADCVPPPPALLPPTERRRTGQTVRLALAAATEATAAEADRAALETIFASGNGDGPVVGSILDALHDPEGAISPTQFHNSVHNAAAGYWHIAVGSIAPSVSVGGHDGVFGAGLLAAATAVCARKRPVLLCAYDTPLPAPLAAKRRTDFPFAAGLVLRPAAGEDVRAALDIRYVAEALPEAPFADALEALAEGNAVARALPLLRAVAARRAALVRLRLTADTHLEVQVAPC